MIDRKKLSKKLSTKNINVEIDPYNFEFYKCKLWVKNECFWIEKEFYIPKHWYYKWMLEEINNYKKDFDLNWFNGKEKWFNKFIVRG